MWGISAKSQIPTPHGFEYIISNLGFSFFWIMFDDFWWYSIYFSWKYEKWKTRNLLQFILPVEFWQTLGYEFHFFQKTWIHFSKKWTNFSIFGRGNPYPLGRPPGRLIGGLVGGAPSGKGSLNFAHECGQQTWDQHATRGDYDAMQSDVT